MEKNNVIAGGFNLPPYWLNGKVVILNSTNNTVSFNNTTLKVVNQFPLTFKTPDLGSFTFPIDPYISISFKNIIARRMVAKGKTRGTIKEHWTEDDAEISIFGVFINPDGELPTEEMNILQEFFRARTSIKVTCDLLHDRGISNIVIESIDFPHTKGVENQDYEIKAYSDDVFELLISENPQKEVLRYYVDHA